MERSIDYLTLTVKPAVDVPYTSRSNYGECLNMLRSGYHLGELFDMMESKGRCLHYVERLSYNDISLKLSDPDNFNRQGFCLEMSGNGVKTFEEYLSTYGYTLKMFCAKWRNPTNDWKFSCTRIDEAMDDIRYNGDRPKLTMNKIIKAIYNDEMVSKARVVSSDGSDMLSIKQRYKRVGGRGLLGTTISLGTRKGGDGTYIRFYDKKIEQEQKKKELPENCTSWVRCEFEFHGCDAMACFNAFIDYSDEDYAKRIAEVANDKVRFVDNITSNVSRNPVKRWWKEFLNGCTVAQKFHITKPVRSALERAKRNMNTCRRNIRTLMYAWGDEGFCEYIHSFDSDDKEKRDKYLKCEIILDIEADNREYQRYTPYESHYNVSDFCGKDFDKNVAARCWEYSQQDYKIFRAPEEWGRGQKRLGGAADGL